MGLHGGNWVYKYPKQKGLAVTLVGQVGQWGLTKCPRKLN